MLYPRNFFEQCVSKAVRAVQPYLAFATYQYHVERARIGGRSRTALTFARLPR